MRWNIGKILISLAAIITAVAPFLADWNDSHLFSPQWSPHARFHGAVSLGMTTILSSIALWLLWRRSPDQDAAVTCPIRPRYCRRGPRAPSRADRRGTI